MWMLSSYALPSLAPAPGKLGPTALRKQPAAVASPLLARPWKPGRESRSRAPRLFTCLAHKFDIPANGLVNPPTSTKYWNITEQPEYINLMLKVGDSKESKEKIEVATFPGLLTIKFTGDSTDNPLASDLDVRLLTPPGCDLHKVKPRITDEGWLEILVTKPKPINDTYKPNPIKIEYAN